MRRQVTRGLTGTDKLNELIVPVGTYDDPTTVDRPLTIKGNDRDKCVLEVTANQPAITVRGTGQLAIESMTINRQLATSGGRQGPASATYIKDSSVTLRNCHAVAAGIGRCRVYGRNGSEFQWSTNDQGPVACPRSTVY